MTIGQKIKEVRKQKGLTQREVGERIGTTGSFIGQYENGARLPKYRTLKKIATALDVSVDVFIDVYQDKKEFNAVPNEYLDELVCDMGEELLEEGRELLKQEYERKRKRLNDAFERLNPYGQTIAVQRVEELGKIQEYSIECCSQPNPPEPPAEEKAPKKE